jgi:hypothetical protein
MNNLQENDRIVEELIPRLISLDQQLATVNAQLQHLSGSRDVRQLDGRRLNAERQRLNAKRQRLVGDIQLHQPQHLQRITRQIPLNPLIIPSIDSDDLSQVTTILDIPFSPSSSIYGPGSAISTSPNSPTGSQGSLHLSDLNISVDNDIIDVDPTPPGSPIITPPPRSHPVPSAPTRSRHRGPVGGTKKKKGKKRKATKKKQAAKKGKKTKKR